MKGWLLSIARTPAFEDDDDRRAAQLLRLVLVVCLASIVGYGLVTLDARLPLSRRVPLVVALVVAVLCEWGLRRGVVRPQAWVIVVGLAGLSVASTYTSGGLRSPASLTLFVTVVLGGQLLGWGASLILAGLGSVGALYVHQLYELRHVARPLVHSEAQYARALVIQLMGTGGLMAISAWSLSATVRRLRREQAAYRDLVEEAPDAMASLDANGRMIQVNRALERMAGRSRREMLGEPFDQPNDAISEEARQKARSFFDRIFAGGSAPLFRFEWKRPDGSHLFAESNARLVQRADGTQQVDLVIRDVSEQVRAERRQQELEEQLMAARKLEAIGQLAGGVAHDFNNLLTVVLGNLQLLRMTKLDDEQKESIASIEEAADRAASITRQLLAIGRRQPSRPLSLSLNDAVRDLADLLRRMVPEHVSISTSLAAEVPNIVVDPGQLDQVVLNLVANARDAMPEGGHLSIETATSVIEHPEQLAPLTPGAYTTLRVRDTGLGMNQETQARVFEPFFTTKGPNFGTGLGLATVYGIVKQHGGHIVVESEPGRGSSFSVYFPASTEPKRSTPRLQAASPARNAKLLLVDDDEAVRRVIATILRRAGHSVTVAGNANEALEAAEKLDGLELLITDVVMPGMSGVDLSRELLRRDPKLRVLLLSGYPGPHVVSASSSGLDYLAKPVTPEILLTRVSQLLGST